MQHPCVYKFVQICGCNQLKLPLWEAKTPLGVFVGVFCKNWEVQQGGCVEPKSSYRPAGKKRKLGGGGGAELESLLAITFLMDAVWICKKEKLA